MEFYAGQLLLSVMPVLECGWYIQCHSIGGKSDFPLTMLSIANSFLARGRLWPTSSPQCFQLV